MPAQEKEEPSNTFILVAVIVALWALLLGVGAWAWNAQGTRIDKVESRQSADTQRIEAKQGVDSDRLARMETKIDLLLQRQEGWGDAKSRR